MTDRTCTADGCNRRHYAHDVCMAHYRAQRRAAGIDAKRSRYAEQRTCECCAAVYSAHYAEQRYCDRTCRDLANLLNGQQARASARGKEARDTATLCIIGSQSCAECGDVFTTRPGRGRPILICHACRDKAAEPRTTCDVEYGACPECNTLWCAPKGCGKIYCSKRCYWRQCDRGRKRGYRKHADAVHRSDGYICWLCGEPTSVTWNADDPMSPTLDHIIPRSLGGSDDPDNLGTAHAICNSLRGAQLIDTITLDLVTAA